MSTHTCNLCEYETTSTFNWNRHLSSKKHVEKSSKKSTDDKYICANCSKCFGYKSNLNRHITTCKVISSDNEVEKLKSKILELEKNSKISLLEQELKAKDREIKYLENTVQNKDTVIHDKTKDIDFFKHAHTKANEFAFNSAKMNALSFLNYNYNKAPPLQTFKSERITKILNESKDIKDVKRIKDDKTSDPLAEMIIDYYKNDKLIEYLSEIIKTEYKYKDPAKQSMWVSDASRLVFIIRDIIGKESQWMYDKKGLKIKDRIAGPLSDKIVNIVNDYVMNVGSYLNKNSYNINTKIWEAKMRIVADGEKMLEDLRKDKKSLKKQLIQVLAAPFFLSKNGQETNMNMIEDKNMNDENNNNIINDDSDSNDSDNSDSDSDSSNDSSDS